jgi:hypothetical protein
MAKARRFDAAGIAARLKKNYRLALRNEAETYLGGKSDRRSPKHPHADSAIRGRVGAIHSDSLPIGAAWLS